MTALNFPNSPSAGQTYTQNGISYTYDGTVWKKIPVALSFSNLENKTAAYTITSGDTGKLLTNNNNFSIGAGGNDGITDTGFSAGDVVSIHNKSSSTHEIIEGDGVTLRFAGTSLTGNRFISRRGLATIVCIATNVYTICGAGLT